MNEAEFIGTFGELYESSPWVAIEAATRRPFADWDALLNAFRNAVDGASQAAQDKLILAHPDLAGRLARDGQLTQSSTKEQARLGLDRLDAEEYAAFDRLNQAYKDKFQFPFIVCLGLIEHRRQIISAFEERVRHSIEEERHEALAQIHHIARVRLQGLTDRME